MKKFLESLNLKDGNEEVLDNWHKENIWNVISPDDEHLLVIFGTEKIHLLLKKNDKFEQLKEKVFNFLSF